MQSERFNNPPLDPAKYGSQGDDYIRTNFYRLESIVDAFDRFVPDWFTDKHGEGRKDSTRIAFEATNTLRRLATERNELKEQVANLKAQVAELQDNLKFEAARAQTVGLGPVKLHYPDLTPRRFAGFDPAIAAPFGKSIHSDAPRVSNGVTTYPQWEHSYTKQVIDELERLFPYVLRTPFQHKIVRDAINLLRDYHATQHEVYEGRDKARARVKELEVQLSSAQQSLETNRRVNVLIRQQRDGAHKRVMQLTETLNAWRDFGANYETSLQRVGKLLKAS